MVGWSEFEAAGTITNAVLMDWLGSYTSATASNHQYVVDRPQRHQLLPGEQYQYAHLRSVLSGRQQPRLHDREQCL